LAVEATQTLTAQSKAIGVRQLTMELRRLMGHVGKIPSIGDHHEGIPIPSSRPTNDPGAVLTQSRTLKLAWILE